MEAHCCSRDLNRPKNRQLGAVSLTAFFFKSPLFWEPLTPPTKTSPIWWDRWQVTRVSAYMTRPPTSPAGHPISLWERGGSVSSMSHAIPWRVPDRNQTQLLKSVSQVLLYPRCCLWMESETVTDYCVPNAPSTPPVPPYCSETRPDRYDPFVLSHCSLGKCKMWHHKLLELVWPDQRSTVGLLRMLFLTWLNECHVEFIHT